MARDTLASRTLLVTILGFASGVGCGPGLTKSEEQLKILLRRPIGNCRSLGAVSGTSGGFGGAWIDNESLRTYASNAAVKEAAAKSATHVLLGEPSYQRNQSGQIEGMKIDGEAFACQGQPKFDTPVTAVADATEPKSAALRKLDSDWWRAWEGSATQPGFGDFTAELTLSRAGASGTCGVAEYPGLGCRGVLTACRLDKHGTLEATQRLSIPGRCTEGAKLRMKLEGSTLSSEWFLPDGRPVAKGLLSLRSDDHPLLAAPRSSLPALPTRSSPVLDDELFEVLPRFLPDIVGAGFVTDELPLTQIGGDSRFRVIRRYRRSDGAELVLAILMVRSNQEGATATLGVLSKARDPKAVLAGFPALFRPAPAASRQHTVYLVLSPRIQVEVQANGITAGDLEGVVRGLSLGYLAQVEAQGQQAASALSRTQEFEDQQGQKVKMATGQTAFADRVVAKTPGASQGERADGNLALGPPDFKGDNGYYTLGCRGKLQVAFDDNVLTDGAGADLHVFEIGRYVEAMKIRISEDGTNWLDAGQVKGQPASLDIASVAKPSAQYRFVEITDVGSECGNSLAGADIDAVGALNGQVSGAAPKPRPKAGGSARTAIDDPRKIAEAVQKSEGVPLQVSMKGRDFTLSEGKSGYTVKSSGMARADITGDGRPDAIVINTRGDARRTEHQLEVYTDHEGSVRAVAQAVIGYGEPTPSAGSLRVNGKRIDFSMSGSAFAYELRSNSLIRLRP